MAGKVLIQNLSESLNGAESAKVNINSGPGHLVIDRLPDSEQLIAEGTLQYLEKQGVPSQSMNINDGQPTLTLKAGDIKFTEFHHHCRPVAEHMSGKFNSTPLSR
jgi:hypothetical protein